MNKLKINKLILLGIDVWPYTAKHQNTQTQHIY